MTALGQGAQFVAEGRWVELAVGSIGVVFVAALAAGLLNGRGRTDADPVPEPDALPEDQPMSWMVSGVTLALSAVLIAGALAAAAAILGLPPLREPPPSESTTAAASTAAVPSVPAPTTSEAAATPVCPFWSDDFGSGGLSVERWHPPSHPEVIRVADGRLAFEITPAVTPGDFLNATLQPRLPSAPIKRVTFMGAVTQATPSAGGVDVIVRQSSGRESRLRLGPGNSGPGAEPWTCPSLPCGDEYRDFLHPPSVALTDAQPTPVMIEHDGQRVLMRVANEVVPVPDDGTSIIGIEFSLDAGRHESWLVSVDDLVVEPS